MKRSSRHSKESKLVPWFLSLLFCVLNGSSLFVCGMFFGVMVDLLAFDKDSFYLGVLVFSCIVVPIIASSYILIREILYKLIHCLSYRAQPDLKVIRMRRGFDIHFPVFEKYGQDYKLLYKRRSKKLQIEYLLIGLGYFCGLTHIVIGYAFILRKILESLKLTFTDFARYPAVLVYMVTMIVIIMGNRSWKKITERLKARENVTVLAVEHGYPIFAAKEEA